MRAAPIPENEAQRLAALRATGILDSEPEPEFDELTQLAAHICGTPMALITLIDSDRQWFKSQVGIGGKETARADSFCAHAICEPDRDVFIVRDSLLDQRFADNPYVVGTPNVRFYAGAPLVTSDGAALGSLCVLDRTPRELSESQLRSLSLLRRHVVNALELRRSHAAQRQAIAELERTRDQLELARVAAEAATRNKAMFLATMSHEIRTPMNAVVGMTGLLQATPLNPEQAECVDTIRTSGDLLLAIINDILDFSKIESGRLDLEQAPFSLARSVDDAVSLLAARSRDKGVPIRVEIDPQVPAGIVGDATRVRQVLVNLLSNALKFTEAGSVTVRLSATPRPDGRAEVLFRVVDTGIGIPEEQLGRLFREYSQAETSTHRRYGGTGLGLSIARRLTELHGGRMWAESEPGRGSSFSFTIVGAPVAAAGLPTGPKIDQEFDPRYASRHPAQILVVDDNPVNLRVASRILQKLGYAPELANGGAAAIDLLAQRTFDVVLMDVEMDGMDGPATTRQIRQTLPAGDQPVVVALTAHTMEGNRERFLSSGMDDHMMKPLRVGEIKALLARLPGLKSRPAAPAPRG